METIDLRRVLQLEEKEEGIVTRRNEDTDTDSDDTIIPSEISARYIGRGDCPGVFMLQAVVSDHTTTTETTATARTGNRQFRHGEGATTGILAAPPGNYWERTPPLVFRVSLHELQASFRTGYRPSLTVIGWFLVPVVCFIRKKNRRDCTALLVLADAGTTRIRPSHPCVVLPISEK